MERIVLKEQAQELVVSKSQWRSGEIAKNRKEKEVLFGEYYAVRTLTERYYL